MSEPLTIAPVPLWRRVHAYWRDLLSHEGRMSRRQLAWHIAKAYGYFVLFGITALMPPQLAFQAWPAGIVWTLALPWMALFATLAFITFFGMASAGLTRRCHDVGLPGWWIVMSFPLVMPGNQTANAYGPPPDAAPRLPMMSVPITSPSPSHR